jgi:hypothetical protein
MNLTHSVPVDPTASKLLLVSPHLARVNMRCEVAIDVPVSRREGLLLSDVETKSYAARGCCARLLRPWQRTRCPLSLVRRTRALQDCSDRVLAEPDMAADQPVAQTSLCQLGQN